MGHLISPAELAELLETAAGTTVVLDARWVGRGPSQRPEYLAGHVPGAHHVDVEAELCGVAGPRGRHPLPTRSSVQAVLRRCGIDDGDTVVVYDDQSSLPASRVWWTLRYVGLTDVRVLDGGWAAWVAAGLPTATGLTPPGAGTFESSPGSLPVLDAAGAAKVAMEGVLLDARSPERFRGETEPLDKIAGHIPGAVNAPMADVVTADGQLRDADELRAYFSGKGVGGARTVGASCGSGITAAHTLLALAQAGFDAQLYVGSWSNWIADPTRPVATGNESG